MQDKGFRGQDTVERLKETGYRIQDTEERIRDIQKKIQDTRYSYRIHPRYRMQDIGCIQDKLRRIYDA
jgi:hypothetical protein